MILRPEQLTLRPVAPADDAFILSVYSSTRSEELERVPWTAEQKEAFLKMQYVAQKNHYAAAYPHSEHDVICVDELAVGRIYVDRSADGIHILDVTVLPEYRSQGIGSTLLRRLLSEAGEKNKPVTIYVETFNPSLRLFERLGFRKDRQEDFQYLMKWQAQP